ncbi:hypothetical protein BU15DRAFT_80701 [Melanogaster broomeanus]|nr:hypothetical protein BU15DRAFT_80701 [Melanogaster broomeanus]
MTSWLGPQFCPSSSRPSHDPPLAIWLVQPARWCCRPCARRVWVRGISGLVAAHLGVPGHDVHVVDVSVPTGVVLPGSRRRSDVLRDVRGLVLGGWQWTGGGGSGDVTRGLASSSPSAGPWVWSSLVAQLVASLPLERHALGGFVIVARLSISPAPPRSDTLWGSSSSASWVFPLALLPTDLCGTFCGLRGAPAGSRGSALFAFGVVGSAAALLAA